jgi:hypothetical protein
MKLALSYQRKYTKNHWNLYTVSTKLYLVVAKVRERFSLRKLNYLEVRKQYQIEITNRFAA